MKNFFAWVVGLGGIFLGGSIMGGPFNVDDPSASEHITVYESIGRYIVGAGILVATFFIVRAINRSFTGNK